MPIWEITDCNGNSHSVDLSKTSIKTIDDVKNEFKKFDEKKSLRQHILLAHGYKVHCEKCGKGFQNGHNLRYEQ